MSQCCSLGWRIPAYATTTVYDTTNGATEVLPAIGTGGMRLVHIRQLLTRGQVVTVFWRPRCEADSEMT